MHVHTHLQTYASNFIWFSFPKKFQSILNMKEGKKKSIKELP